MSLRYNNEIKDAQNLNCPYLYQIKWKNEIEGYSNSGATVSLISEWFYQRKVKSLCTYKDIVKDAKRNSINIASTEVTFLTAFKGWLSTAILYKKEN